MRYISLVVLVTSFLPAVQAERQPVENFLKTSIVSGVALSGDGKAMAFQGEQEKNRLFAVADWNTERVLVAEKTNASLTTPIWISDDLVSNGFVVLDRAGKNKERWQEYSAARFAGDRADEAIYLAGDVAAGTAAIVRVNSKTGAVKESMDVPLDTIKWLIDGDGFFRAAVQKDKAGVRTRIIYRKDKASPWIVPAGLDYAKDEVRAHWLSGDGKLLYLSKVTTDGTWGVYSYDLEEQRIKELILSHTQYDILEGGAPILARRTREILGFYYVAEKPSVIWFDRQMAAAQEALDYSLPNHINTVTSLSDDRQRMIVLSWSASDPGTYYRFDVGNDRLKPLMPRLPWIDPSQMAEVRPISFQARDGLTIHGYLTLPSGREPENLPLVVLPHDDLTGRDGWDFNLNTQFLANRGYAVLQVNFRGSTGYGVAFSKKGFHRIGSEVQDDITDGARWTISQGIADPRRIAIMGTQIGGYSALMGAMLKPRLYCCAVGISAVTNWAIKKKNLADLERFKEQIGDPDADAAELANISPVNHAENIDVPLLLIYDAGQDGYKDLRESFSAFTKGLKKAGKSYEVLDYHNEFGSIYGRKERIEILNRIEGFLAKHMPARK